jgi:hypothetical protein
MRRFSLSRSFRSGGFRLLASAALLAALAATPFSYAVPGEEAPLAAPSSFDGVWEVTVQPDGTATQAGKQTFVDLVLFENGKLTASACAQYGFAPADFTAAESSFTCSMTSDEQGTIAWSASMANGRLSGNVVWSKPDGNVYRYSLAGERYVAPVEEEPTQE